MRKTNWKWVAKGNYRTLLKCVLGEKDAPYDPSGNFGKAAWRIEALRTLHEMDGKFNFAVEEPELHAAFVRAVESEFEFPKSTAEHDRVQAWMVCLLGQTTPARPDSFFVDVLQKTSPENDPDYLVCLSALNVLYPHMDALAANAAMRREILYRVAQVSGDIDRGCVAGSQKEDLVRAVNSFQQQLKTYPVIVDLLQASRAEGEANALLEILKWNYQQMKVGAHLNAFGEGNEFFGQNITTLLALSWHDDAEVRSRSRLILAEFAPRTLFDAVVGRIAGEDPVVPEDYRQLAALMIKLDDDVSGKDADYRKSRSRALDVLFDALPAIPEDQREIIYGEFLPHCPDDLYSGLLASNERVLAESGNLALQHLRYMEHLRGAIEAPDAGRKIDDAIGAFMRHGAAAVKKQVAASLAGRDAVFFACCCATAITAVAGESTESAGYLMDAYMDTLAGVESAGLLKNLRTAMGAQDPYELLAYGVARSEPSIKSRIVDFMRDRNCDLLVGMLSRNLGKLMGSGWATDGKDWCLLGDIVQQYRGKLDKRSLASATGVFELGLGLSDQEQAILCARYLLELGYEPSKITGRVADIQALAGMMQAKGGTEESPASTISGGGE